MFQRIKTWFESPAGKIAEISECGKHDLTYWESDKACPKCLKEKAERISKLSEGIHV